MNTKTLRMKGSKRGVTPVIATIILIAGTLVLALVVGAYTFGLFGSNVKTVTLSSATLYGGLSATAAKNSTSSLTVALNNPGSATYISSVTMTGAGISTINAWDNSTDFSSSTNLVVFTASHTGNNAMGPGAVTSFTYYPENAAQQSITTGQVFNYVINFANGQSVSGSLIAQ
ncbi:MAG: archaellin/type IV pilin N-terminal domain-containing protein [Nitrososphaerales archaeon]